MNQKISKKEVKNEFEGGTLNYVNSLYDNIDLINRNISRQEFISKLQEKYSNEEMKGLRKKRFAEIAYIFEDLAIEANYGKKPEEDPSFFAKIKESFSFRQSYDML